jgi:hypothetical protein
LRGLDESADAAFFNGVPPDPALLQRARYDDAAGPLQNCPYILLGHAAAHQNRQMRCRADLLDLFDCRRVSGSLARHDDAIGLEKVDIARQLRDRAVRDDRMGSVLYMAVGEDTDTVRAKRRAIAQCLCRGSLYVSISAEL